MIDPVAVQLLHEPTLMRLLINYSVASTPATANSAYMGAMGVIRWSGDPDSTAIPADPPEPIDDANLDWAWHTYLPFANRGVSEHRLFPGQAVIDVGSMRKLSNSEGLLFCVESQAIDLSVAVGIRYLLKQ